MILATVGHWSLVFVLLCSLGAAAAIAHGVYHKQELPIKAGYAFVALALAAGILGSALLWWALLTDDFRLVYVASQSSVNTPLPYKIGAFWGGQEGSLLLWLLILLLYMTISTWVGHRSQSPLQPLATTIMSLVAVFFAYLVSFVADPFAVQAPPADGNGLNPLLQDPFMMLHPLALYAGYVGFTIPFAYCLAALLLRRTDDAWIRTTRRWSVAAWGFLSLGILLGGSWAYQELGWGGYWGWDPVENSSLLPWLVSTAFIHSVMIQEKRGMFKLWNVALILTTYVLTLLGTFLTRSGMLVSVHSFAQSDIGPWFFGFIGVTLAGSLYVLFNRLDCLKDERRLESYVSKEAGFLLNNVVFAAIAFAIGWGTLFPVLSRLFGTEVTVGVSYYERVVTPFFAMTLFLMGVGPLLAWRKTTLKQLQRQLLVPTLISLLFGVSLAVAGVDRLTVIGGFTVAFFALVAVVYDIAQAAAARYRFGNDSLWLLLPTMFGRNPRKYGGYFVHIAVVIIAMGVIGSSSFSQQTDVVLQPGESTELGGYRMLYRGLRTYVDGNVPVVAAEMQVFQGGKLIGTMSPSKRYIPEFVDRQGPYTQIDIRRTLGQDLYVVFAGWDADSMLAGFKIYINPMVNWIWLGGLLLIYGTIFSLWPRGILAADQEQEWLFRSWSELEYDYEAGKIAPADYEQLRREYMTALSRYHKQEVARKQRIRQRLERELADRLLQVRQSNTSTSV